MLTSHNRHYFMRLNMKKSKSVGLVVDFIIIILISSGTRGDFYSDDAGGFTGQ